jgi:hypothetical protein
VSNTTRAPVAPLRVAGDGRKQQPSRAIIGRPILDTLCDELGSYRPLGSGHAGTATGRAGKIRTIVAIPGQLPAPLRAAGVGWIDSMEVRSGAHRLMRPRSRSACLRPSPPGGARHRECRNNRESLTVTMTPSRTSPVPVRANAGRQSLLRATERTSVVYESIALSLQ